MMTRTDRGPLPSTRRWTRTIWTLAAALSTALIVVFFMGAALYGAVKSRDAERQGRQNAARSLEIAQCINKVLADRAGPNQDDQNARDQLARDQVAALGEAKAHAEQVVPDLDAALNKYLASRAANDRARATTPIGVC